MAQTILHIENLSKSFDGLALFKSVNLNLSTGTINSLFGGNGTGKTTFFNLVCGYEKLKSGIIVFNNVEITGQRPFKIAKHGVGKMWQEPATFPNHTLLQNLLVSNKTHPGDHFWNYLLKPHIVSRKEDELTTRALDILTRLKLQDKAYSLAGSLSLGERKLLSIASLIMNDATLLMLDEPFSNINPATIERISAILYDLSHEGRTIFMIEHKLKFANEISDHVYKIDNQQIFKLN